MEERRILSVKKKVASLAMFTLLLLGILSLAFNIKPVKSSHTTIIYFDPSSYIFNAAEVSVGYRFNATIRVSDVENLAAWEVCVYYNTTILHVSRYFEPSWDPEYVFYGKTTWFLEFGIGDFCVGALLVPLPPEQEPFYGDGILCIIEFEILQVPAPGETYSSILNIDNDDTFLLDSDGNEIPAVKENGYYEIRGIAPPHDVAVNLFGVPSFLELGNTALLNAIVRNIGLNNETNVELQLLINDTVVNSILIPELLIEESYTLSYSWTPSVVGVYNVTAYAVPVPDENLTANNLETRFVRVLILPEILIVNDDDGWNWVSGTSLQEFESALTSVGYDYWVWSESSEGRPPLYFLKRFKLVIWSCGDFWNWAVDQSDAATLQSYLAQGGNILLEGEDIGYNHYADEFMVNVAHATYQVDNTGAHGLTVTDPTHPVTFNLPTSFTWLTDPPYDDGVTPTNGGAEVIKYTGTTWTAVTVFGENVGGKVVYYAFPLYCLPEPHRTTLAVNSINWLLGIRYEHELGVKLEAPDVLQLGKTAVLNATIYNYGLTNETDVKLQLLINNTEVYSVIIPELLSGSFYTFNYSWTPTVEGLYNVSVYAPPIPGEEITTNNLETKNVKVMAVKVYQLSHTPRRIHGDENYIYYTAENGGTYRINKVTGVEEFFSQYGHDLIWVEGNYVYVGEGYELSGSYTNDIYKYDKNGNLIWHVHPTYGGPWGGATFQFGVGKYYIYAVAGPYAYGAISKENGNIVWVSQGGVTRYPDMVIADLKNDVVVECGYWSPNTIQRISKVDGHIIWQRKGPSEEMGECTRPVDITDDAIWVSWYKGEYPYNYFYALAKWDRNTGALIQAFPELPYNMIWHVGPEGSLTFDYPYEAGNALVWNYQTNELCKVNTNTWEVYWSTDIGYPLEYCINRLFIDKEFIYLIDKYNPKIIYQYKWTTPIYYTLTIETTIGGTTSPNPGTYTYTAGSMVQVTAIPYANYKFDYWELNGVNVGSANPYTVLMDKNHTLRAVFSVIPLTASINPLSASILVGQSVTFTSTISGGYAPYSYQWYLNNSAVSGATLSTWTFTPLTVGTYKVYLNVTDSSGNVAISETATITVAPQLTISISPMSASIIIGQSVTFTSTTSGGYPPYTYQWFLNGNPVSGATSNNWTFTPTTSGIFFIHLKVTDDKGNTAQSDAARIVVSTVPVGGYSIPMQAPTKTEPILPYIAIITTLTIAFTKIRNKTKRKH